jgi:hypothetical protein
MFSSIFPSGYAKWKKENGILHKNYVAIAKTR